MTTSPTPWSLRVSDVVERGAIVLDAHGCAIAGFTDYRNAEYVLSLSTRIEELEQTIESLELDLERAQNPSDE